MEVAITFMVMAVLLVVALLVQKSHYMGRIHYLQGVIKSLQEKK